jgi:hypothetical protein
MIRKATNNNQREVPEMVFCGDCGRPTRLEGRFRKCDTCRISTRQKRIRPKSRKQAGLEKLEAALRLEESLKQAQEMLDSMQVNQFGDSVPT